MTQSQIFFAHSTYFIPVLSVAITYQILKERNNFWGNDEGIFGVFDHFYSKKPQIDPKSIFLTHSRGRQ